MVTCRRLTMPLFASEPPGLRSRKADCRSPLRSYPQDTPASFHSAIPGFPTTGARWPRRGATLGARVKRRAPSEGNAVYLERASRRGGSAGKARRIGGSVARRGRRRRRGFSVGLLPGLETRRLATNPTGRGATLAESLAVNGIRTALPSLTEVR